MKDLPKVPMWRLENLRTTGCNAPNLPLSHHARAVLICVIGPIIRTLGYNRYHVIGNIPKFGHVSKYMLDVLRSGFHIGLFPWSGAAYLVFYLFTFVSSVVLSIVQ